MADRPLGSNRMRAASYERTEALRTAWIADTTILRCRNKGQFSLPRAHAYDPCVAGLLPCQRGPFCPRWSGCPRAPLLAGSRSWPPGQRRQTFMSPHPLKCRVGGFYIHAVQQKQVVTFAEGTQAEIELQFDVIARTPTVIRMVSRHCGIQINGGARLSAIEITSGHHDTGGHETRVTRVLRERKEN